MGELSSVRQTPTTGASLEGFLEPMESIAREIKESPPPKSVDGSVEGSSSLVNLETMEIEKDDVAKLLETDHKSCVNRLLRSRIRGKSRQKLKVGMPPSKWVPYSTSEEKSMR